MKVTPGQKKLFGGIGLILLITVLILVVHSYKQEKAPVKVGLALTLTGRPSTFGVHIRNGVILAMEAFNRSGGLGDRRLELIVKDDKANLETSLQVARELLDADATAIIGHSLSTPTVAVVPLMNRNKRLIISATASTADLSGIDDWFLRITTPVDIKAPSIAALAVDRLRLKSIAVVYDLSNPNYTLSLFRYFKKEVEKLGGRINKEVPFDPRDGFSAPDMAQKISTPGTEGIFLISNAIHAALIAQHARRIGSGAKIIVSQWGFPDPAFVKNGGQAVEGAVSLSEFNADSTSQEFLKLSDEYERRFGVPIGSAAQRGYEVGQILFSALAKTKNPSKLKAFILEKKVFNSVDGNPIIMDSYGDCVRTLFILEIKNGKIRTIGSIAPS